MWPARILIRTRIRSHSNPLLYLLGSLPLELAPAPSSFNALPSLNSLQGSPSNNPDFSRSCNRHAPAALPRAAPAPLRHRTIAKFVDQLDQRTLLIRAARGNGAPRPHTQCHRYDKRAPRPWSEVGAAQQVLRRKRAATQVVVRALEGLPVGWWFGKSSVTECA
jgi:hypothetical protein